MEKNHDSSELSQDALRPRERKFGDTVIQRVLDGAETVVVNPRLLGFGFYRRQNVYPYIQKLLSDQGIKTAIVEVPMESGSEAPIPKHILTVVSRPGPEVDL